MEILILAVVLFILGVGATIVYDKHKDKITATLQDLKEIKVGVNVKQVSKQTTKIISEVKQQPKKASSKPLSQKKPLTQKDLSVNSTLTMEELIQKLEAMKKRN